MILCCGEALIDMIPVSLPDGGNAFAPHTGGAIFNTAIALGRLGVPAGLLSGVSTDRFGQMLAAALRDNNVDTRHLIRSDRLSTLAMVHLVDGSAEYAFYDENSAGRSLTAADMPDVGEAVTALYFGGISLVAEPAADAYADLMARSHAACLTMLDPNIRTGFISDEARYRTRLRQMTRNSDILKVSDEDLHWLVPGEDNIAEKAKAVLDQGPSLVIVTLGAEGAMAVRGEEQINVAAVPTSIVDTVGAGDTFNAGFLAGLSRIGALSKAGLAQMQTSEVQQALELGARVAAVTVSRAGANPPWADEVGLAN